VVFVTARRAGKGQSATSRSMTARSQTALDTASALLACAFVRPVGKARSVNRVSDSNVDFLGTLCMHVCGCTCGIFNDAVCS
jgi:hypothetical protein